MPYRSTGRRVGRPRGEPYRAISVKLPQDLYARVQGYARRHRQSLSELIRDGLQWRIGEEDARKLGGTPPDATREPPAYPRPYEGNMYSGNTEIPAEVLQAILAHVTTLEAKVETLLQQREPTTSVPCVELSGAPPTALTVEETPPLHSANGNTVSQESLPSFDATRYVLGPLCHLGHDYDHQGLSLRQVGGKHECRECKRLRSRRHKQHRREAQALL